MIYFNIVKFLVMLIMGIFMLVYSSNEIVKGLGYMVIVLSTYFLISAFVLGKRNY